MIPKDWQEACIVPLYKGKENKRDCANYRGIRLLSIPRKLFGRVIIERVIQQTESQMEDKQGGFRRGRDCVDQVFGLKEMSEKYLRNGRDLYVAFMDLEKAYDETDRKAMWQVLQVYGVGGKLLRGVKYF